MAFTGRDACGGIAKATQSQRRLVQARAGFGQLRVPTMLGTRVGQERAVLVARVCSKSVERVQLEVLSLQL